MYSIIKKDFPMKNKSKYSCYICENHLVRKKIHSVEIAWERFFVDGKMVLNTPIEWKHLEIIPTDLRTSGVLVWVPKPLLSFILRWPLRHYGQNFPTLSKNDETFLLHSKLHMAIRVVEFSFRKIYSLSDLKIDFIKKCQ